jgi:uncharacterized protein (TIGR00290 family)
MADMTSRVWMSWSSGKDSTVALHSARSDLGLTVERLLVTLNAEADRVAMHAVRRSLLEMQAERLNLPLYVIELPYPCPNHVYEKMMDAAITSAAASGIEAIVFGDLFLDDVREYRERAMLGSGIRPVFPLWHRPTEALARDMIGSGMRAILTCVDLERLPASFAGRDFDEQLLGDLPAGIDPCGERGEFHTFVWDGPGFREPIDVRTGETVIREGFAFCDVLPVTR